MGIIFTDIKNRDLGTVDLSNESECERMAMEIKIRFGRRGRSIHWRGSIDQGPKGCLLRLGGLYDSVYWNPNGHGPANNRTRSICRVNLSK